MNPFKELEQEIEQTINLSGKYHNDFIDAIDSMLSKQHQLLIKDPPDFDGAVKIAEKVVRLANYVLTRTKELRDEWKGKV